jgi:hypothetical protein
MAHAPEFETRVCGRVRFQRCTVKEHLDSSWEEIAADDLIGLREGETVADAACPGIQEY